ncbi:hypothetical protein L4D00_03415 [Photobacterium swingsii]|uniref:capsular polysaccharide export protein, LipB/KpsS family n=1 Tax=Photobacterium swingsii TaxID=680026 RepID=UPI003D11106D
MILYYADNIERAKFWMAISAACSKVMGDIYYTNELNVYLYLRYHSKRVKLITHGSCRDADNVDAIVKANYEFLSGDISYESAIELYRNSYSFFKSENLNEVKYVFVWNGESLIAKSILNTFSNSDIEAEFRFFEIANLPGKIFVDPKGTNGKSLYSTDFREINSNLIDENVSADYKHWLESYKSSNNAPKQVKKKGMSYFVKSVINESVKYIGYSLFSLSKRSDMSYFNTVQRLFNYHFSQSSAVNKTDNFSIDENDLIYFVPFQVSNDTQLVINSDVDNLQLLKYVVTLAKEDDAKVIAKIHPAEENIKKSNELMLFGSDNEVRFENSTDSNELIKVSSKVFTINSTVGLQAMILGKDVEVLGNAVYKNFNKEDLEIYITRYLLDIDYFNPSDFDSSQVNKVFNM